VACVMMVVAHAAALQRTKKRKLHMMLVELLKVPVTKDVLAAIVVRAVVVDVQKKK